MAAAHFYNLPEDAVWFITGSSSGIGLSLAEIVAAHPSHRLVATARNSSRVNGLLKQSDRVHIVDLDVTSEQDIDASVEAALAKFGRIDVLVNNAGYALMGDSESALQPEGLAKARKIMETDFWGTVRLSLHAMRVFRDENPKTGQQGGVVLNVTSLAGFMSFPGNAFYHAAKFGVEGLTESLSKEVRPEWNIHFCIIEPGSTRTNFATTSIDMFAAHPAYTAADTPARIIENFVFDTEKHKHWTPASRVAGAMYHVVARAKDTAIPMRLPLCAVAWQLIKGEIAAVDKELDEVKELSLSVDVNNADETGEFLASNFK